MAPVSTWKKQKVHKDNMLENRQKKSQFRYFMECFWEFVTGRTFGVFLEFSRRVVWGSPYEVHFYVKLRSR